LRASGNGDSATPAHQIAPTLVHIGPFEFWAESCPFPNVKIHSVVSGNNPP
jgi:hypothetical protein